MACETYPQLRVLIEEDPGSLEIYQQLLNQADPAGFKAQPFLADMALKSDTDMFVADVEIGLCRYRRTAREEKQSHHRVQLKLF